MKRSVPLAAALFLVLLAGGIGLLSGFRWGAASAPQPEPGQTFYATVEAVQDGSLLVCGLDVNDINHRCRFSVQVGSGTRILWHYEPIPLTQLKPGHTVAVTYVGGGQETDPVGLTDVPLIQLLDDEL